MLFSGLFLLIFVCWIIDICCLLWDFVGFNEYLFIVCVFKFECEIEYVLDWFLDWDRFMEKVYGLGGEFCEVEGME